jgi:hypothetical protein
MMGAALRSRKLANAVVALGAAVLLTRCGGSSPTTPTPPPATLAAPVIDSPVDGAEVSSQRPTLTVINVFSAQATPKTYDFQVSDAVSFTRIVVSKTGVAEAASGKTSYTLEQDLATEARYYWRARAQQGTATGAWSAVASFRVGANTPPVIRSVVAQGSRPGEPAYFADLDEEITVTATVEDAQVAPERLVYEWSAPVGTFTGAGASVRWRAPKTAATPTKVVISLTVRDAPAPGGATASSTVPVNLHDSVREIGEMAVQFLTDFSKQLPPADVLRNFSDTCGGKAAELGDVQRNQRCWKIDSYVLGTATTAVSFGGACTFRDRRADACTSVPVDWRATYISSAVECAPPTGKPVGTKERAVGLDWVTAVYVGSRWWLCDSDFDGTTSTGARFSE